MLIVAGLVWGGYGIYQSVTGLTDPEKLASRNPQATAEQVSPPQESVVAKVAEEVVDKIEHTKEEPLPVVASSADFILVEGWDIVRAGEELPDGTTLQSWTASEAVVLTTAGTTQKRRFRRALEVLASVVATGAALPADPVNASSVFGASK